MINLECLCSTVDIAPEVNGSAEECWRAEIKLGVFSQGIHFTPASPSPEHLQENNCDYIGAVKSILPRFWYKQEEI